MLTPKESPLHKDEVSNQSVETTTQLASTSTSSSYNEIQGPVRKPIARNTNNNYIYCLTL